MGQPSDETLARRAQSGDADAFAVLMGRYTRTVLTLAYRMLGDLQEAEEITQEVFIRIYRSLGSFDPSRPFFSWLYPIAVNRSLKARASSLDAASLVSDPATSPEQQATRGETQATVQRAIAQLPDHERVLVALLMAPTCPTKRSLRRCSSRSAPSRPACSGRLCHGTS